MKKTIFSLALGTFGLGMAEFGIMGVLTELAHDTGISIPSTGNMISFYAFGVVIGAPIVALFSGKFSLKTTLLFLVAMCAVGNALFTFSTSYFWLALGRLISGFPHGAIFGVGAIILSKIAPPGKVTVAVAGMIAGMTVANLVGVPLGTWLGHQFSWRYTFFLIAVFDALAEACPSGLAVFAGKARPQETIEPGTLQVAHHQAAANLHLPFSLCWQGGLLRWLETWQPQVLKCDPAAEQVRL